MRTLNDDQFLNQVFLGNEAAIRLARMIVDISCTWDDLVDRDNPVSNERINQMMWAAMVSIPMNPFYRKWIDVLQPLIQQSIINWHAANTMEKEPGISREIAHVARYSPGDILIFMVSLVSGTQTAIDVAPEFKLRLQRNAFSDYDAEMNKKHQRAEAP